MKRSRSEYKRGNLKKESLIDVILQKYFILHEIRDIKFPKVEISCIEV